MKLTQSELGDKLKEEDYSEEEIKSLINVVKIEYNNLKRKKECVLSSDCKLLVSDWEHFLFAIGAFDNVCGPYTNDDARRLNKIENWVL